LQSDSKIHNKEYIYIIREREFIRIGENIYKIGKSCQENCVRTIAYPKGSELIMVMEVSDCKKTENSWIQTKLYLEGRIWKGKIWRL